MSNITINADELSKPEESAKIQAGLIKTFDSFTQVLAREFLLQPEAASKKMFACS
jgi:hypothetical protein